MRGRCSTGVGCGMERANCKRRYDLRSSLADLVKLPTGVPSGKRAQGYSVTPVESRFDGGSRRRMSADRLCIAPTSAPFESRA